MEGWELLGVIIAVVVVAIPVAVVALIVSVGRLKARVAALEREAAERDRMLRDLSHTLRAVQMPPSSQSSVQSPAATAAAPGPAAVAEAAPVSASPPGAEEPAEPVAPVAGGPWSNRPPAPLARSVRRVSVLGDWLRTNWVFVIAAVSLALAGLFLVQYGIENGLLPPTARVAAALVFGLVLIAGGEVLRRRWGDRAGDPTAYLPSTFSGAGLVSIFGGIVAARQLYGLVGPGTAFAGIVATALLAIMLGWFSSPLLAAIGLVGAAVAPFVVGGESEAPHWLYVYFTVIAATGLLVDTVRRWAWVSVLAVLLGIGGGWLVHAGTGGAGWFALMLVAVAGLAVLVPARALMPDHAGRMAIGLLALRGEDGPRFPTLLAAGTALAVSVLLLLLDTAAPAESLLALLSLAVLALAFTIWSGSAPALSDLTLLPAAAFLLRLGREGLDSGPLAQAFAAQAIALRAPETAPPITVTMILALAALMSLGAAWASGTAGRLKPFWAAGAAVAAPVAALVLELFWTPSGVLGAYPWALHVMALATLMAGLAVAFARADGGDMRRTAYMVLSALSLIALALFLILTKGALTLALAALVTVAATLDRRFRLVEMGLFIQAGVIALSWRLVVDPGLGWAVNEAALWEAVASYGGAATAMAAGLMLLAPLDRRPARVLLESAFAAFVALFANVLISRWLIGRDDGDWIAAHWALSLNAVPWLILMLVQLYRLQLGGALRWLRWGLGALAAVIGFGGMAVAVTLANPLGNLLGGAAGRVHGPPLLDTLCVAYALPAVLVLAVLPRLGHVPRPIRWALLAAGAGLLTLYAGLEIRRLIRGDDLAVPGVTQGELHAYTLALVVLGAGLLYQAIARRSPGLRRAAMTVIGLTIAKVFLIDISGLSGLTRVFSFLALGFSLAGLAWLNRWAARARQDDGRN